MMNKKVCRILAAVVPKGGVGKTNTIKNVAAALSLLGKKVLIIDFDPQANATLGLIGRVPLNQTVYNLLMSQSLHWQDFVKTYKQGNIEIDLIPGGINLAVAEMELAGKPAREFTFRNRVLTKIQEEGEYDFILIDCQPSLGLLVVNVLCASSDSELIVCVRPDEDSQEGIDFLFKSIRSLQEDLNVRPKSFKILVTQVSENTISHRKNLLQVERDFPSQLFDTIIKKDVKIEQARDQRLDIFTYDSNSPAAISYMKVAEELTGEKYERK